MSGFLPAHCRSGCHPVDLLSDKGTGPRVHAPGLPRPEGILLGASYKSKIARKGKGSSSSPSAFLDEAHAIPVVADRLAGTLLGTALGMPWACPAEGMSARSIARRFGRVDRFRLLGRTGFVSDDTEQAALIAQSLARHPDDPDRCVRAFRRSLLGWFCRLPWGVGKATIRSCVRIGLGLSPERGDVGRQRAAMRAGIVGAFFLDRPEERERSAGPWPRSRTATPGRSRGRSTSPSWPRPAPVPRAVSTGRDLPGGGPAGRGRRPVRPGDRPGRGACGAGAATTRRPGLRDLRLRGPHARFRHLLLPPFRP